MARKADGTIYINTKIDSDGAKVGIQATEVTMKRFASKVSKIGETVKAKIKEMSDMSRLRADYDDTKMAIAKTKDQIAELTKKQQEYLASGGLENKSVFKSWGKDIDFLEERLKGLYATQDELERAGATSVGPLQKLFELVQQFGFTARSKIESLKKSIRGLPIKILHSIVNGFKKLGSSLKQLSIKALQKMGNAIKKVGAFLKNTVKSMLGFNRQTQNTRMSMGRMLATSLLFSGVFRALSSVMNGAKEGMQNLAQYSDGTNDSLSALTSSLTQLKNSFATAFSPILTVITPILTGFINMLSHAATYVGMFFAALTGQNSFTKAVAVQEDYAAGLSDTASNAKKAEKALKSYQSPLDQINTMDSEDNSSSNTGSGNVSGVSPGEMFETVPIENSIKGMVDKIKNIFQSEDWEGLGTYIAGGINSGFQKIYEIINWNNIGPQVTSFVLAFTTTLNSLTNNIDWGAIGNTIGAGVNTALNTAYLLMMTFDWRSFGAGIASALNNAISTINWTIIGHTLAAKFMIAINFLYGFVTTFDWSQFGISIANSIMGFFNGIDWGAAGTALSTGIRGLFASVKELIANIDWQQLGNDVWLFLSSIDWGGMIADLAYLLGEAIAGIGQFLWGFIEDAVNDVKEYFAKKTEEAGFFGIVGGFFKGIIDAIGNLAVWIEDHIFDPFVDGFKKLFGIHSPSTVMAELASYLIQGLKNGLVGIWNNVKEIFENLKNNIALKFSETVNKIKAAFSLTTIKSHFQQILTAIQNIFSSIPTWFKNTFQKAWQSVKDVFSKGGKVFTGIKDGILSSLKAVINGLISGINKVIKIPFDGINTALKKIKSIEIVGIKPFKWISTISTPQIPYLATGAVIPPNAPFVAMLGDQKRGNNIETPEALLRKIVREETGKKQSGGNYTFIGQINRRTLFEEFIAEAKLQQQITGKNPLELA